MMSMSMMEMFAPFMWVIYPIIILSMIIVVMFYYEKKHKRNKKTLKDIYESDITKYEDISDANLRRKYKK